MLKRTAAASAWAVVGDGEGDTVLLGRGGSDTSAAIFAAKVGASRLEVWTDVPGMFTANPRDVPGARLLRSLDYDEAQELATTGAKVLHPRCIAPVRAAGIPLHTRTRERNEALSRLGSLPQPPISTHVHIYMTPARDLKQSFFVN